MLKGKLLAVLALHDGAVFVERVVGEVVQVSEMIGDVFDHPFNREVGAVLDRRAACPLEEVGFISVIGHTGHASEALEAARFVDREYQNYIRAVPVSFGELASGAVSGGPDGMLVRDLHAFKVPRFHHIKPG